MSYKGKIVNALAGHFETSLNALPPSIQATVREAFWYGDWDILTPTQRISLAWQYDTPETDAQRLTHQHQVYAHASALAAKAEKAMGRALAPEADLQHALNYSAQREQAAKIVMPLNASIQQAGTELLKDQLTRLQAMPTPTGFEQAWQVAECARITTLISQAATPAFDPEKPLDVPTISVPKVAVPVVEVTVPDPVRRLAALRALGGTATRRARVWRFTGIAALVKEEIGRKRSTEKTIRDDLKVAAQDEYDAKQAATLMNGLGQSSR